MGLTDALYRFGAVPQKPPKDESAPGAAATPTKFVYITRESLTFPGVTIAAGVIARLVNEALDVKSPPNLGVSAGVAIVVGLLLTWLALAKATKRQRQAPGFLPESILVAFFNTALLIAAIHGFAEFTTSEGATNGSTPTTVVTTTTTR